MPNDFTQTQSCRTAIAGPSMCAKEQEPNNPRTNPIRAVPSATRRTSSSGMRTSPITAPPRKVTGTIRLRQLAPKSSMSVGKLIHDSNDG